MTLRIFQVSTDGVAVAVEKKETDREIPPPRETGEHAVARPRRTSEQRALTNAALLVEHAAEVEIARVAADRRHLVRHLAR